MKKILHIMLGTACNWKCGYCLQIKQPGFNQKLDDSFCDKLNEFLLKESIIVDRIEYWGGEPCLYFDQIRQIESQVNNKIRSSRFVTNGSLLSDDIVRYLNEKDFFVNLSYHEGQLSDEGQEKALKIRNLHVTSLIHSKCLNWEKYYEKQSCLYRIYGRCINQYVYNLYNVSCAKDYCLSRENIDQYIEYLYKIFPLTKTNIFYKTALDALFSTELQKNKHHDCACFNDEVLSIDTKGNQYICHHACDKLFCVGNIFKNGLSSVKINSLKKQCEFCKLRAYCNGGCMREINDSSCYFLHKLYDLKRDYDRYINEI